MSQKIPDFEAAKRAELTEGAGTSPCLLNDRERGDQIIAACEAAMQIERAKRQLGFPESIPAPWPPQTWEFLKKCAASVRTH